MKVASGGRVTIPKKFRERFDLRPGDEVEFIKDGDEVIMRRLKGQALRKRQSQAGSREPGLRRASG
jgi:AbrB family looped-hinge helix DNA binding protein